MNIDILLKLKLNRKALQQIKLSSSKHFNGIYLYDSYKGLTKNTAYIHLGADDFQEISDNEDAIIDLFTKVATHETLHHIIYGLTSKMANGAEEKFILLMAGQRGWRNAKNNT